MTDLQSVIDKAFEARAGISPRPRSLHSRKRLQRPSHNSIPASCAVAEKSGGEWVTHQWLKKAVLLSFSPGRQ